MRLSQSLPLIVAALNGGVTFAMPAVAAASQDTSSVVTPPREPLIQGVITVSGDSVERLRMAQLEGTAAPGGLMLRSTSSLMDPARDGARRRRFTIVSPTVTFVHNSELAYGQNDGALWAGVGTNARLLGGFTVSVGPLRLIAIPELVYSANDTLSLKIRGTRSSVLRCTTVARATISRRPSIHFLIPSISLGASAPPRSRSCIRDNPLSRSERDRLEAGAQRRTSGGYRPSGIR